jgi:hypothetical protein
MTLEEAIKRERLSDELRAIQFMNVAQQPDERRARLSLRQREILSELAW